VIFAEIMDGAGVPKGVFNLVQGDGPTVGTALAGHPDVDMVSFTGSTRAGTDGHPARFADDRCTPEPLKNSPLTRKRTSIAAVQRTRAEPASESHHPFAPAGHPSGKNPPKSPCLLAFER
jgi:hypothetical protein